MTVRRINSTLWTLTALCAAGSIVVVVAGLLIPTSIDDAPTHNRASQATTKPTEVAGLPPLAAFEPIFNKQLRQSLSDRPATTQPEQVEVAAPAPVSSAPVTLVGTIGASLAMFQSSGGEVELKAVGETAGGMKVIAIRPSEVDVQLNGKVVTLRKPKEAGS
jgi:hypothetical protein